MKIWLGSLLCCAAQALAQPLAPQPHSSADLLLAIQKMQVVGSVLYIAAHPDDENTALLAYMARGRKVRTGYLSLTRGDGGQNLIGTEQGELMGTIRTQELLAARRIDGAEQFFTRANDFGYSKSPEEAFRIWNRDSLLADVVWVIRNFRPDVIITRFPTTGEGGHGHHTASAILAVEAFEAAADPKRYPAQLQYVQPWQVRRVYWNAFNFGAQGTGAMPGTVQVDLGSYNTLLGVSYAEIAGRSRSQHKSQGFGAPQRRGMRIDNFKLLKGDSAGADVLDRIDLSWGRVPNSEAVARYLKLAEAQYDVNAPDKCVPLLLQAYQALQALPPSHYRNHKLAELQKLILDCAGFFAEAVAEQYGTTPGSSLKVTSHFIKRGTMRVQVRGLQLGGVADTTTWHLRYNNMQSVEKTISVPANLGYSTPYWLQQPHGIGFYTLPGQAWVGLPEGPAALQATATVQVNDVSFAIALPVRYKWLDPVDGELYRPLEISPPVTVSMEQQPLLFADAQPRTLRVKLQANQDNQSGTVQLQMPAGYQAQPASHSFSFAKKDQEQEFSFNITATPQARAGKLSVHVQAGSWQGSHRKVRINYPHIPIQTLYPPAELKLVPLALQVAAKRVGYVPGAGDDVPAALLQMGVQVRVLTDEELSGDYSQLMTYDAIVVGVRAYNTQERIGVWQQQLLQYVQQGGTLVVQFNTNSFVGTLKTTNLGPYPFNVVRDRVTEENAKVSLSLPQHPILNLPNRIGEADFMGWVQERSVYHAGNVDAQYERPLTMNDTGEAPLNTSLIYARYGKGHYIYTGLALFRQLPAGVPGSYRLLANMISLSSTARQ